LATRERGIWQVPDAKICSKADVPGFGVPEHHGDGSALPMLVKSGNLSLEIWSSGDVGYYETEDISGEKIVEGRAGRWLRLKRTGDVKSGRGGRSCRIPIVMH
jgi:hypothetical protein